MAGFIFIVAGLNLALGYLMALLFAPELQGAVLAPAAGPMSGGDLPMNEPAVEPVLAAASTALLVEPEATPAEAEPIAAAPLTAAAPAVPAATPAQPPELGGELIDQFKGDLHSYREQLVAVDKRLRSGNQTNDVAAMQACLADLFQANARYLAQQDDSGVRLQRQCEAVEEHKPIARQLGTALDEQTFHVRGATDKLEQLNASENTPHDRQQIFHETARLIDASNSLRDTLDDVEQQLAGGASRANQSYEEADLSNKLVTRARFEAVLAELWQADRTQPMSLGLVDLDRCRELNESRGIQVGDRALATITRLVVSSLQQRQLASRLSGEKFLLLLPGRHGRESTGTLELIRQQVETTHFQSGTDQFDTSVSCAVVETVAGDQLDAVLDRLEITLQEAKRCGRNRTFFHDGKFPTPVVPPILSLQPRTQEI